MMPRPRSWASILALAAITGTSFWLLTQTRDAQDPTLETRGPAWYFDDAHLLATGDGGVVLYRIDAPRIEHDPADDSAVFESPAVRWLQGSAPPLVVTATTGRADVRAARIRLEQDVRIVDAALGAGVELVTDWLEVDANARIARTDAPVRVTLPQGEMYGIGLFADLNSGTISIRSSVSARYGR